MRTLLPFKSLMKMTDDPYADHLFVDLQARVADLTRALRGVVAAAGDMSLANREEAMATARRVLAQATPRMPPAELAQFDMVKSGARAAQLVQWLEDP
jgi:hypothetical protein